MYKIFPFCILVLLVLTACQTSSEPNFNYEDFNLSQYKNPNLTYVWNFNESKGHTYNSTFFQVRPRNCVGGVSDTIGCPITFKHEEGHILLLQTLNMTTVSDLTNKFITLKNKSATINDHLREDNLGYGYFIHRIGEGIPEYYSLNFFDKTLSSEYLFLMEQYLSVNNQSNCGKTFLNPSQPQHYYCGYLFVDFALSHQYYESLYNLIADFGSEKQYDYYKEFNESFK